jgi:dTDP-L-rhamnose 4-epimerase
VHGADAKRPAYLDPEIELIEGDVRDPGAVRRALARVDAVCHLAAMVGVGQSMYALTPYTAVNSVGTAVLLEAIIAQPVERLVVASSMSVYGEGLYRDGAGRPVEPGPRPLEQLKRSDWDLRGPGGEVLEPVPTPEARCPGLASLYALTKYDQERMCLLVGGAYNIPTVALRLFNAYGPHQALSNPYTGVLAIFAARLLNDNPPLIFEDGKQLRDFVAVEDVAEAIRLALTVPGIAGEVFNIGSGRPHTIAEVAAMMAERLAKPNVRPELTGQHRVGDIRHCFADISKARRRLGFRPKVRLRDGIDALVGWLDGQIATDRVGEMRDELLMRGLAV